MVEAKAALVGTNKELKEEKRKLQGHLDELSQTFEQIGGADGVKRLLELKTSLEKDEAGKLLSEGKHDEWFESRTAALRSDHESQVTKLQESIETANSERDAAVTALHQKVLNVDVLAACGECKVESTAIPDVVRAAREVFQFDTELQSLVQRGKSGAIVYGKKSAEPPGGSIA